MELERAHTHTCTCTRSHTNSLTPGNACNCIMWNTSPAKCTDTNVRAHKRTFIGVQIAFGGARGGFWLAPPNANASACSACRSVVATETAGLGGFGGARMTQERWQYRQNTATRLCSGPKLKSTVCAVLHSSARYEHTCSGTHGPSVRQHDT